MRSWRRHPESAERVVALRGAVRLDAEQQRQRRLPPRQRPLPVRRTCSNLVFLKVRAPPEVPRPPREVAARPAREVPARPAPEPPRRAVPLARREVRAKRQAHPTKALPVPPALRSWAHPRKMPRRVHSRRAPAGSRAECSREALQSPSRSRADRALERPAARRPTKALAARPPQAPRCRLQAPRAALPRREAIPRSAQAVTERRPVVVAARPAREAAAQAPEALRAVARPKRVQVARRLLPSSTLPAAEAVAPASLAVLRVQAEGAARRAEARPSWVL